ncbi:MAG: bifunctional nicotinamidase/pyrazinamidase [Planctomycetota bacterium]
MAVRIQDLFPDSALILVDIQNDFLPGGALAVPAGDEIVPVANWMIENFDRVFATQDWHPANHGSFASQHPDASLGSLIELNGLQQVMWPDHCVQGTPGAEFASSLKLLESACIVPKGTDTGVDSYSGFFDNGKRNSTELNDALHASNISHVFILGLATDYCVKFTALDARELGYRVTLVEDGCRGVNLNPNDVADAMEEMKAAGIEMSTSEELRERIMTK